MIFCDVPSEAALWTFIKSESIEAADEANVCHVLVAELLLVTQLRKGVDDDTEQDVHDDDFYNNEEANIWRKLDPVELHVLSVVNLLSDIANTTTFKHAVACHAHKALKHCAASVFTHLSRIVAIEWNIDNGVLHVEERNCSKDINRNDHQQECPSKLIRIHCHRLYDIRQSRELNDDVQQMEGVVELVDLEAQNRDAEVQHIVLKDTILQKEVDVVELNLHFGELVSKVWFLSDIELLSFNALRHKYQMSLLNRHLLHIQTLFILSDLGSSAFVGLYKATPTLFSHKGILVYDVEDAQCKWRNTLHDS